MQTRISVKALLFLLLSVSLGPVPASEWIDVREFGTKGDGRTDDAPALQRAIDEAAKSHRDVFIPRGTFVVGATLRLPSHTHIRGSGLTSVLRLRDGANIDMIQNANPAEGNEGIIIEQLKLDGNKSNQTLGDVRAINHFVIRTMRASRCRFQDLTIVGAAGDGIANWGGEHNLYLRITATGAHRYGIQLQGAKGFGAVQHNTVEACATHDCGWDGITLGHGMDNRIMRCVSYRNGHAGIAGDRASGVRVSSCLAYENVFYGIAVADAALRNPPHDWIIESNRVLRNRQGGIGVLNGAHDVSAVGNSVVANEGDGIWVGADCHGVLIQGNRSRENGRWGIRTFGAWGLQILNNMCWNNGKKGTADGIACLSTKTKRIHHVVITGNVCFDDQESKTQRHGICVGANEGVVVRDNRCEGNLGSAYRVVDGYKHIVHP